MLRKPHTAFGRSGEFTPGGNEFDEATKDLAEDDLLVPWLMAGHAKELGYSVGSKKDPSQNDHRNQTRYFYLYMLFRVASQVLSGSPQLEPSARLGFYKMLPPEQLDRIHVAAGRDHQDPPQALLRHGQTAHPQGAPLHIASCPALSLGRPVQSCPGTIARPAISCLTATVCC